MDTVPPAPGSARMITVASPSVGDISPLLSAATREIVNLSSPSSCESGRVRNVICFRSSPCSQEKTVYN